MKSDISTVYKLGLTKEEKKAVEKFCHFMSDVMEWEDDYRTVFDIMDAIWLHNQAFLDKVHFEIYDIEEEKEEG